MRVHEDKARGVLSIDGREVSGFLDDGPCPRCRQARAYAEDHDAFFCPACNEWLETACSDSACAFCRSRPERPLPKR